MDPAVVIALILGTGGVATVVTAVMAAKRGPADRTSVYANTATVLLGGAKDIVAALREDNTDLRARIEALEVKAQEAEALRDQVDTLRSDLEAAAIREQHLVAENQRLTDRLGAMEAEMSQLRRDVNGDT